ncbi:MAG: hypothetical protein AAGJ79_00785 [Verrucomicrobiota bacterium]
MPGFKLTAFNINLPFGLGGASLNLNESQVKAAWELYVEYSTRISTQALAPNMGSAREALSSLHSLFDTTRSVLRSYGPGVGQGQESIGPIAIRLLNEKVRPFLLVWHTNLSGFEDAEIMAQQASIGSQHRHVVDEAKWESRADFYDDLNSLRKGLVEYVDVLAAIAGVTKAHEGIE